MLGRGDIVLDIVFFLMIVFCIGLLVYLKREPVEFVDSSLKRDWEDLKEKFANATAYPCQEMWGYWENTPLDEMHEMDMDPANSNIPGNIFYGLHDYHYHDD